MSSALHPAVEPYEAGFLDVSDGHSLYWETTGNPTGTPVLYLHGGPGSGCTPVARRFFDPNAFRAVLFDQRGCGRSRPLAAGPDTDLSTNTTAHLMEDIERLRKRLGIRRWVVAGVSWGVTLSLVYAQRHPERVLAMALGAITSGSRTEIDWITRDMGRIFPREWEEFIAPVPVGGRHGDLVAAYARLLADPDAAVREEVVCVGGHPRVVDAGMDSEPPIRGRNVPDDLRQVGDALLEPRVLPRPEPDTGRNEPSGRYPGSSGPRPLRCFGTVGHGLEALAGLAGKSTRRG